MLDNVITTWRILYMLVFKLNIVKNKLYFKVSFPTTSDPYRRRHLNFMISFFINGVCNLACYINRFL
ncbi:hypothetical protein KPC190_04913 [Klebsiella pneumoniae]|nr:hypothetical protein [Klebsiella pneumoniae]